ncbi:MAG: RNA polymerase sigma factor [Clostridium butyricum]|nr:RNA polymerase sigma factor [Clostridium butyricum]
MEEERNLIERCKQYDKYSFMELLKKYEKYLYSLCFSYVQNPQDALDLVQEVYIKIFKNISKFDVNKPFRLWIRKIAVNTCLNFKRTIKNNVISINDYEEITFGETISSDEDVLENVINTENKLLIKKYLGEISEEYRMVIILRYYEDLSYNEIAEIMNMPLGTVKTKIYRAKALLGKKLKNAM